MMFFCQFPFYNPPYRHSTKVQQKFLKIIDFQKLFQIEDIEAMYYSSNANLIIILYIDDRF